MPLINNILWENYIYLIIKFFINSGCAMWKYIISNNEKFVIIIYVTIQAVLKLMRAVFSTGESLVLNAIIWLNLIIWILYFSISSVKHRMKSVFN